MDLGKFRFRIAFFWTALTITVAIPIGAAATSPLLEWRDPVYIGAGLAGVFAMALLLLQPMLAAGYLPGFSAPYSRRIHRWTGIILVLAVTIHVVGLWITSPPDVIDALLFTSPTPFSIWGVIAMWSVFASACLAAFRRKLRLNPHTWRLSHRTLAAVIVVGSIVHAMMIEGTMEIVSKSILCTLILIATAKVLASLK